MTPKDFNVDVGDDNSYKIRLSSSLKMPVTDVVYKHIEPLECPFDVNEPQN